MADDIVTRLREQNHEWLTEGDLYEKNWQLWIEAADEIERLRADRDRWVKWGEHVFTCPNKGLNPCRDCVSPATADAMSRVDRGEAWHV